MPGAMTARTSTSIRSPPSITPSSSRKRTAARACPAARGTGRATVRPAGPVPALGFATGLRVGRSRPLRPGRRGEPTGYRSAARVPPRPPPARGTLARRSPETGGEPARSPRSVRQLRRFDKTRADEGGDVLAVAHMVVLDLRSSPASRRYSRSSGSAKGDATSRPRAKSLGAPIETRRDSIVSAPLARSRNPFSTSSAPGRAGWSRRLVVVMTQTVAAVNCGARRCARRPGGGACAGRCEPPRIRSPAGRVGR
jgi:hypothetical protein